MEYSARVRLGWIMMLAYLGASIILMINHERDFAIMFLIGTIVWAVGIMIHQYNDNKKKDSDRGD